MKKNQTVFNLRVLLLATCIPILCFSSVEPAGAWQGNQIKRFDDAPYLPKPTRSDDYFVGDMNRVMTDAMGLRQRPVSPLEKQVGYLKKARTEEQKEIVKKRIRNVLGQQYDAYLNDSAGELTKLESRLEILREKLETRKQAKEKLIEIELQRIVNETEGLVWPTKENRRTDSRFSADRSSNLYLAEPRGNFSETTFRNHPRVRNDFVKRGFSAFPLNRSAPPAITAPLKEPADDDAKTENDLRQIALGCLNFESSNKHFPQNVEDEIGTPTLSWRVAILPFIGEEDLYKKFHLNEPWDSPHNKKLLSEMPAVYSCDRSDYKTNRLGIGDKRGIFEAGLKLGFGLITDGSSNTILCFAATGDEHTCFWTEPSDLTIDEFIEMGTLPGSFDTSLCDGGVVNLSDDVSRDDLRRLATRNDGDVVTAHVKNQ